MESAPKRARPVGDGYFESYAHLGIHEEMLRCRRTDAYLAAIRSGAVRGKSVLDVGAGTGVLAIACAQSGARVVYAVEASEVAACASRVVEANSLSGVVRVIHGRMEDVDLPEKVDVIVSEWMGCLLLYESMLDSVLIARDRWLKPEGVLVPRRARIHLAPYRDDDAWEERVAFWGDDVHGIDMSCLAATAASELARKPIVEWALPQNVVADACVVADLDLRAMRPAEAHALSAPFAFRCHVRGELHAFVGHFDVELLPGQWLSTAPSDEPTHWRHTLFYLETPLAIQQDSVVRGTMSMAKQASHPRCWDVRLQGTVHRPSSASATAAAAVAETTPQPELESDEGVCFDRAYELDVSC